MKKNFYALWCQLLTLVAVFTFSLGAMATEYELHRVTTETTQAELDAAVTMSAKDAATLLRNAGKEYGSYALFSVKQSGLYDFIDYDGENIVDDMTYHEVNFYCPTSIYYYFTEVTGPSYPYAITQKSGFTNDALVTFTTDRGGWALNDAGDALTTTKKNPDATDAQLRFAVLNLGDSLRIYVPAVKKFLNSDNTLVEGQADAWDFEEDNDKLVAKSATKSLYVNINSAGDYIIDSWSWHDAGNLCTVNAVEVFTPEELQEATGIFNMSELDVARNNLSAAVKDGNEALPKFVDSPWYSEFSLLLLNAMNVLENTDATLEEVNAALATYNTEAQRIGEEFAACVTTAYSDGEATYAKTQQPVLKADDTKLLTDVSQLSSNHVETTEGSLAALIDGNPSTFFHSSWSNPGTDQHYLQIYLPENTDTNFWFEYTNRAGAVNDHIKEMVVYGCDDADNFEYNEVGDVVLPVNGAGESGTVGMKLGDTPYKYYRFQVIDCSPTYRTYFHAAEWQFYKGELGTPEYDVDESYITALREAVDELGDKADDGTVTYADVAAVNTAMDNVVANAKVEYTVNITNAPDTEATVTITGVNGVFADGETVKCSPITEDDVTATDYEDYVYTVTLDGTNINVVYDIVRTKKLVRAYQDNGNGPRYLYASSASALANATTRPTDGSDEWYVIENGDGTYKLKNVLYGTYINYEAKLDQTGTVTYLNTDLPENAGFAGKTAVVVTNGVQYRVLCIGTNNTIGYGTRNTAELGYNAWAGNASWWRNFEIVDVPSERSLLNEQIEKAQEYTLVTDELGYLTSTAVDELNTYITAAQETANTGTEEECKTATETLADAIARIVTTDNLVLPQNGKLYVLAGANDYCAVTTGTVAGERTPTADEQGEAGDVVWYYNDTNNLIGYTNQLGTINTSCTGSSADPTECNAISFQMSNNTFGKLYIVADATGNTAQGCGTYWYNHGDGQGVNRNSIADGYPNCDWDVAEVDEEAYYTVVFAGEAVVNPALIYNSRTVTNVIPFVLAQTVAEEDLSAAEVEGYDAEVTLDNDARVITVTYQSQTTGINNALRQNNGKIYDLQGRQMNSVRRGLYIVNGKKVVK